MPKKLIRPTITLPSTALIKFKNKALKSNKEILVFLVGSITKENDIITHINVEEFYYPPVEAGKNYVSWNPNDVVRLQAQILPRHIIGTLHSHPNYEPHISREDVATSQLFGDIISGVYSWWRPSASATKKLTDLTFYYNTRILEYKQHPDKT